MSIYINVLQTIYYVRLPQPVGKDEYTFVHLLKESAYPLLNAVPINLIHVCKDSAKRRQYKMNANSFLLLSAAYLMKR